jgi:amino acid transporter
LGLGGAALLGLTWPVAIMVALLLVIVVTSYRQTCFAYPSGGGAYAVSKANLGTNAALIAASALLIDYVLTVAVSVVAGVANLASAIPSVHDHSVLISVFIVVVLALVNLRGTRESGKAFALPTYAFIVAIGFVLVTALIRIFAGNPPVAQSASFTLDPSAQASGILVLALALRAFASGCTALTGVEAISNGVPHFQPPKAANASRTLLVMGAIAVTMFLGVTALSMVAHVQVAPDASSLVGAPAGYVQPTVIAQITAATIGTGLGFYLVQAATVAILVLAANTAFNGFPTLASILGRDGFAPNQLGRRGDRLVFSNGIVALSVMAILLIIAFDADTTRLIQLYIIGVFISFTLSQAGMVKHWTGVLKDIEPGKVKRRYMRNRAVNFLGAAATALVLVIVLFTKFTHGAWIVVIAIPLLFLLMKGISRHYDKVAKALDPGDREFTLPARVHSIVLISKLNAPALQALAFARASRPHSLTALYVVTDPDSVSALSGEWERREIPVPLVMLDSPFRDITGPVLDYVKRIRRESPMDMVCVYIPEYVVTHFWEQILHNQSALRLKTRLLFTPGILVTSVPFMVQASTQGEVLSLGSTTAQGRY